MYAVHFFDNKNLVLCQLLKRFPSVGEDIKIKGRKGKISSVLSINEKVIHVHVTFEAVKKSNVIVDPSKKKRR